MSRNSDFAEREAQAIGSTMWLRFYPLVVSKSSGSRMWDADDNEYLDFMSQWGVMNLGQGHPAVVAAIKDQVDRLVFSSHLSFPNIPAIELAEKLIEITPGNFPKKAWFGLSGSDANEFIYKIFPVFSKRKRFLSFYGSYHGMNMGGITLSGHKSLNKHVGFGNSIKAPFPNPYRCPFCTDSNCTLACAEFIEDDILEHYPTDDIAAAVVEPMQSDGGDIIPPPEFMPRFYKTCKDRGISFVADEVKIGFGRTGKMFAIEHSSIAPDAISMGKPMASGMPLSGVVGKKAIMDADIAGHFFTSGAHPVSCAASLATVDTIQREGLVETAASSGDFMMKRVTEIMEGHPLVGDVRGKGLFVGVELVKDRETKEAAPLETACVVYRAWQLGLIIGYVGTKSNVLELMPPLNIAREDLSSGLDKLEEAVDDVEKGRVDTTTVKNYAGW